MRCVIIITCRDDWQLTMKKCNKSKLVSTEGGGGGGRGKLICIVHVD